MSTKKERTISLLNINTTLLPLSLGKFLPKLLPFKHSMPSSVNLESMAGAGTEVEMDPLAYSVCKELQQVQNILPSSSSFRYLTVLG